MDAIKRGSCLCGAVRYELTGEPAHVTLCHCGQCRKASGSAFAVNGEVQTGQLRFVAGEDTLRSFASSPGKERVFCGTCGSPILSRRAAQGGLVRLRLGTLDAPIAASPEAHIFVRDALTWLPITDGIPQHDELEPRRR